MKTLKFQVESPGKCSYKNLHTTFSLCMMKGLTILVSHLGKEEQARMKKGGPTQQQL